MLMALSRLTSGTLISIFSHISNKCIVNGLIIFFLWYDGTVVMLLPHFVSCMQGKDSAFFMCAR